jgi:hypothetical protein
MKKERGERKGGRATRILHVRKQPVHGFLDACVGGVDGCFLAMQILKSHARQLSYYILICHHLHTFFIVLSTRSYQNREN